jgi:hypothetical protein
MELYLSSTESGEFYSPKKVVYYNVLKRKKWFTTEYFLHVEFEKTIPLFGLERYGINQKFGANFILTSRYMGENIIQKEFPMTVNIFIPRNNNFYEIKNKDNLIFYSIGKLYNNLSASINHI